MLCGEKALLVVEKMMKEIYRVLADDGYYIIISNANEDSRKLLFDENMWEYKVMEIEKPSKVLVIDDNDKNPKNYHYIYVLNKKIEEKKEEEVPPVVEEEKNEENKKKETKKEEKTKKK